MFNFKEIISSIADAGQKLFSIKNIKKNNSFSQFLVFIILLLVLGVIGLFTLIKVAIPFTYVAL